MSKIWKHLGLISLLLINGSVLAACSIDQSYTDNIAIESTVKSTNDSQEEIEETKETNLADSLFLNDENVQHISIPRSDFVLTLPRAWNYELKEFTESYGVLVKGPPGDSDISFFVAGQRLHENQDTQIIINNFLGDKPSEKITKSEIDGISYLKAQMEPDEHGSILQFALLETETQYVIVDGNNPERENDKSTIVFNHILDSLEIIGERSRKAVPAEKYQLGESSFSIRRLEEYKIEPFLENSFKVRYDWPGDVLAPKLDIMLYQFENSQLADEWLRSDHQLEGYNSITELNLPGVNGFVAERESNGDSVILKYAPLTCGNEGLTVILLGNPNMPAENEDVFWTAIETVECDG